METKARKVTVEISLPNEILFQAMLMAHNADITLNQWMEKALRVAIKEKWVPRDSKK